MKVKQKKKVFSYLKFVAIVFLVSACISAGYWVWNRNSWETYTNKKLGFQISYPKSLKLTPKEIDIQAEQREESRKCKAGELPDGCGGSKSPEYQIKFDQQDGKTIADIEIYVTPFTLDDSLWSDKISFGGISPATKEIYNFGLVYGVLKDDFSFFYAGSLTENVNMDILEKIAKSFRFIEPEKPLKCLWTGEFLGSSSKILPYFKEANGYFYDQTSGSCKSFKLYVSAGKKSPEEVINVPFSSLEQCQQICTQ